MPLDTFICGICQGAFNDIEVFMQHKNEGCLPQEPAEVIQVHVSETGEITEMTDPDGVATDANSDAAIAIQGLFGDSIDQGVSVETSNGEDAETQTLIILNEARPKTPKKKGRPKKGEEKNKQIPAVSKEQEKPSLPDRAKDGKFHCVWCKRAFTKERFFNTHKCLASSDYVDITKKDIVKIEGDEEEEDVEDAGAQEDEFDEYTAPNLTIAGLPEEFPEPSSSKIDNHKVLVWTDPDGDTSQIEKATDTIEDIPVFRNEEEKAAFEQNLNVDLSSVDHMFKIHMIDQDLNENAASNLARNLMSSLSLYSCNACSKIFKTLSHMRLHCLIHTDLKPFKCIKCSYSSNSKGNLYTHMRKHTGQFYKCSKCDFRTVNKSHLLEHEATHSNTRQQCDLCKKDYNTLKSLINHVRKYHRYSKSGKDYLQSFLQGRQTRGSTVIHQCHVCNRKFKKKIDRDRHLFIHDIKDIPNIQHCELCDYTASRRIYLEKHYLKHRVIYRCYICQAKFLSTVRLIDHLTSVHLKDDSSKWETLFEQSINNSLYLPEPGDSPKSLDKGIINLPAELSSSTISAGNPEFMEHPSTSSGNPEFMENSGTSSGNSEFFETQEQAVTAENVTEPKEDGDGKDKPVDDSILNSSCEPSAIGNAPSTLLDVDANLEETASAETEPMETDLSLQSLADVEMVDNNANTNENDEGNKESDKEETPGENLTPENGSPENPSDKESEDETRQESLILPPELNEEEQINSKGDNVIKRLNYHEMSMQIFHKMRETFGNEECEYCGRLFCTKADFESHVRTHTGDKPFSCEECGYKAITRDNLKRHREREHENMRFPCKECEFVATSRTQLWNHHMKHLGVTGLECPECKEKFDNMKKLKTHIIIQHPDMNKDEFEKLTGYRHRQQGKIGRRSYKCPYCDRVFVRASSELQKHIWIHEGIKPYKCPICPHACRSKNNLQAHMLRHSSEKPFVCSECNKAYKSKTALRWHVRSHKDGKLFKCDKCPYEATQSSHLKRHMETHDIVKRFVCQHCNYSANTLGYMKIHYSRNHKGIQYTPSSNADKTMSREAKVYKCLSCDYLFGNLSDLKRHLKIRHHVQVQDIAGLGQMQVSEVEVLHFDDETLDTATAEEVDTNTTVQELQQAVNQQLDEKTATAVNLLQQIIDMSQQGAFGQQQITVQSEDGQMVAVNPETIIVQQDGEEVLVTDGNAGVEGNQYVIQYVSPQDTQLDGIPLEIQTTEAQ